MKTYKISCLKVDLEDNDKGAYSCVAKISILCDSQQDFEHSLRDLLPFLLAHNITRIIFKAGDQFALPDWFKEECKKNGIEIAIVGKKYYWSNLNHLQIGRYSEHYVKMEFIMYGLDVYTPEIDDKGIDFVIKNNKGKYFEIQVKAVRGHSYVYMKKNKFYLSSSLFLALVILNDGKAPELFLIPSTVWHNPNQLFVSHDYKNKKSSPEWGINLSTKNISLLIPYRFNKQILKII